LRNLELRRIGKVSGL